MQPRHLLPLCLLACGTGCASPKSAATPEDPVGPIPRLAGPTTAEEALATIARLEDARQDGAGLLQILALRDEVEVRKRALVALGRLPLAESGGEVTGALSRALDDPDPAVRAQAAFSIGIRGDARSADALLAHWADPEADVRAAIIEAASRIDVRRLREEVLYALEDPAEVVRIEAVIAPHRWSTDDASSEEVDSALIRVLRKRPRVNGHPVPLAGVEYAPDAMEETGEVLWRTLFTLSRRRSERARSLFQAYATAREPALARLFAVKGLTRIEPDDATQAVLASALADNDWRVACEAVRGLAAGARPASITKLTEAARHASPHVRAAAVEALGGFADFADAVAPALQEARDDRSRAVRAAAIVATASVLRDGFADDLRELAHEPDPVRRIAAAEAAAALSDEVALPLLEKLAADGHPGVAAAAIAGLGTKRRDALVPFTRHDDTGLRLAALGALSAEPQPSDLSLVRAAYQGVQGDGATEVKFNALRHAGELGTKPALAFVSEALGDSHPYVRQVAREVLAQHDALPARLPEVDSGTPGGLPPAGFFANNPRPVVEVETSRGTMTIELFADETPVHAFNFLELARSGHYDGLTFHRVVGDFVIQGGCHRGDGNGSVTWRGDDALRHEISRRKYVRGSLGMPRNEDPESGGSQIFVTHRPTPHLDGRYTIFGEITSGFEVLDAVEVGDVIVTVRELARG